MIVMEKKKYIDYCTGCGLCKSVLGVDFKMDKKGYNYPELEEEHLELCKAVCPAGGKASLEMSVDNIWGKSQAVYIGWSTENEIRSKASSGGVLTALCCYLLDRRMVDGIIQTKAGDETVYSTVTVISRTKEDVLKCMGSRYSISAPLSEIKQCIKKGEVYAFVGKPCDVSALRMYLKQDKDLQQNIKFLFSFFCAGEPSVDAQRKLLVQLGCKTQTDCESLLYRGNGWPGFATAVNKDGTKGSMTYNDSWGKILGRDVRKSCRFCLDGVGEFADVACGDAWHLTVEHKPDFSESDGRNVILARTESGKDLVNEALAARYIYFDDYSNKIGDLKYIQKYQYERKATMGAMLFALRLFGISVPQYDRNTMRVFAKQVTLKRGLKRFLGTVRRIKQGKFKE